MKIKNKINNELNELCNSTEVTKHKHKHHSRHHRNTFLNEIDEIYNNRKRNHSYPRLNGEYDEQYIYTKHYDDIDKVYKKEIVIKQCKKIKPIDEENSDDVNKENEYQIVVKLPKCNNRFISLLSNAVLKPLVYLGIITCIAV